MAALALAGSAALAADIAPVVVPPAPAPVIVSPPAPVFDWAGVYFGARGTYFTCDGPCWINVDGHAGFNFVAGDRFLVGVEIGAGYWSNFGDDGWLAAFSARTGVILGRFLAYGRAGFTVYGPATVQDWILLGGGVEVGLGRSLSVFAGFTAERDTAGGGFYPGVEAGVNFHLGN
jgi:hypothetical protein